MGTKQSIRQEARRAAARAAAERLVEARERERRLLELAVEVIAASAERQEVAQRCDKEAATAAVAMVDAQGLTVSEVVAYCGNAIDKAEVSRLRRSNERERTAEMPALTSASEVAADVR